MPWLDDQTIGEMSNRVRSEFRTTFACSYAETIGLGDVLDPVNVAGFVRKSTGSKYLIDPSSDRP